MLAICPGSWWDLLSNAGWIWFCSRLQEVSLCTKRQHYIWCGKHINKWFFFHFIVWLIGKSTGPSSSWCQEKAWEGGRRTSGKTRDSSGGIKPWWGTDTEEKNQTVWEGQRVIHLIKLLQIISTSVGINLDIYLFNAFNFFFFFNRAYERRQRERQVAFRSDFNVEQHLNDISFSSMKATLSTYLLANCFSVWLKLTSSTFSIVVLFFSQLILKILLEFTWQCTNFLFLFWNLVIILVLWLERFSNDCRKTKTKAITLTNHNRNKQRHEPITIPSNYL